MNLEPSIEPVIKNNVLIVDDHPFIISGYKNAITRYNPDQYEFVISEAKDCESGYKLITDSNSVPFDYAFLDISMPSYDAKSIFSGEDLALLLKKHMPNCKVILLTMYTELLKIRTIIENIDPAGLVIKNDLTFDELLFGFDKVVNNDVYLSESIKKMLEQSSQEDFEIDHFDKQILHYLSKGTKAKDMSQYIPITENAIDRRKQNLKYLLGITKKTDSELVREARVRGILF